MTLRVTGIGEDGLGELVGVGGGGLDAAFDGVGQVPERPADTNNFYLFGRWREGDCYCVTQDRPLGVGLSRLWVASMGTARR